MALLLLCPLWTCAQVTIVVTSTPQLTPLFDTIYVTGSFNDWNPNDPRFKMVPDKNTWRIEIPPGVGEMVEFKFTRGSGWGTVEGSETGEQIPNRSFIYVPGMTVECEILGWEDLRGHHTVEENVFILDADFPMPQLGRTRRIWIRLPQDYDMNVQRCEVLYMQDGQNVFDAATSFAGEWQVDETLNALDPTLDHLIVVAIDNGGVHRLDEYAPFKNEAYGAGGEGDLYLLWMVETLKPFVDDHFRTIKSRQATHIAGSSLGALISFYGWCKYQEVFSKAGIFSPAFWFNPEIYDVANSTPPMENAEICFICGDAEDPEMERDMEAMFRALGSASESLEMLYMVVPGGQHNESLWSQQFPYILSVPSPKK
ncbi:MAG: hypothetical protein JNM00_00045 [Flavobacteriales bacterium]|nr:hypothetical protein [Flavobacteriales bacterium]